MKKFWWLHLAFWLFIVSGSVYGVKRYYHYQRKAQFTASLNVGQKAEVASRERPFVFVVTTFNSSDFVERNLTSLLEQDYKNYRVIYVDDCSTDNTYQKVMARVEKSQMKERFQVIRNAKNCGAMENIFRAVHECQDDEIVALVDGDDWLAHANVLKTLNLYYENNDVWLTYGDYLTYPEYEKGVNRPVSQVALSDACLKEREKQISHLRTFYAGLFKQAKISNFLHKGKFYPVCSSEAVMLTLIELARTHTIYVPEILYIKNLANPISDTRTKRERVEYYKAAICKQLKNPELETHPAVLSQERELTDIVVFSYNRPLQLFAFLESLEKHGKGFGNVFVIYRSNGPSFSSAYTRVKEHFPCVEFIRQPDKNPHKSFKPLVIDYVFNNERTTNPYVAFAVDDIVIKDTLDFNHVVSSLKKYQAYGFYLRLGTRLDYCFMNHCRQKLPNLIPLHDDVYAWQFSTGTGDWDYENTLDMTVYNKKDIFADLSEMQYTFPNTMEEAWSTRSNHRRVGLCYKSAKIVNIPLNIVSEYEHNNRQLKLYSPQELLEIFQKGKKMDISDLYQLDNHSAHIEYEPKFVVR